MGGANQLRLAAFLPATSLSHIRRTISPASLHIAKSWRELDELATSAQLSALMLDPNADGRMDLAAAIRLLVTHPAIASFAYVPANASSLRAVVKLHKVGL